MFSKYGVQVLNFFSLQGNHDNICKSKVLSNSFHETTAKSKLLSLILLI